MYVYYKFVTQYVYKIMNVRIANKEECFIICKKVQCAYLPHFFQFFFLLIFSVIIHIFNLAYCLLLFCRKCIEPLFSQQTINGLNRNENLIKPFAFEKLVSYL